MAETIEVKVPDIGDYKDVPVIEVFVKPGDRVKAEDSLITVESDKATMEVPSPGAGTVKELRVKVGDKVSQGSAVLVLETEAAAQKQAPAAQPAAPDATGTSSAKTADAPREAPPAPAPTKLERAAPPSQALAFNEESASRAHASPSVRRTARELGVDLSRVTGSGPKNRIVKEDIDAYVKAQLARDAGSSGGSGLNILPLPQVDFSRFGETRTEPLSRIKKLTGANLHRNWVTIPHVTQNDEADITELEAFRKSRSGELKAQGVNLTLLAFLIKASVTALKKFPQFNASLSADSESLILKQYYNIGVAVDTPNGLVVPVLRAANSKGVVELARELFEVSERMRAGKIVPADMQGGCFSISSLGGIGGGHFTPIINAPEVAILGVGRSVMKPVWNGTEFTPRLMLPLSLSYDHRVIDGALGARFITYLSSVLADIRNLVL
ncbi:MAG: dihydrolipoyllysine-residue acetyltransferase [Pseudomonadota bacterium]